jgi:hypothetical protein
LSIGNVDRHADYAPALTGRDGPLTFHLSFLQSALPLNPQFRFIPRRCRIDHWRFLLIALPLTARQLEEQRPPRAFASPPPASGSQERFSEYLTIHVAQGLLIRSDGGLPSNNLLQPSNRCARLIFRGKECISSAVGYCTGSMASPLRFHSLRLSVEGGPEALRQIPTLCARHE